MKTIDLLVNAIYRKFNERGEVDPSGEPIHVVCRERNRPGKSWKIPVGCFKELPEQNDGIAFFCEYIDDSSNYVIPEGDMKVVDIKPGAGAKARKRFEDYVAPPHNDDDAPF